MNEPSHRLRQRTEEQSTVEQGIQRQQGQAAREFASVEELIRHDAASTDVPSALTTRIQSAVTNEPARPAESWWRRWLGR